MFLGKLLKFLFGLDTLFKNLRVDMDLVDGHLRLIGIMVPKMAWMNLATVIKPNTLSCTLNWREPELIIIRNHINYLHRVI